MPLQYVRQADQEVVGAGVITGTAESLKIAIIRVNAQEDGPIAHHDVSARHR